jgi:hypothetical protein
MLWQCSPEPNEAYVIQLTDEASGFRSFVVFYQPYPRGVFYAHSEAELEWALRHAASKWIEKAVETLSFRLHEHRQEMARRKAAVAA